MSYAYGFGSSVAAPSVTQFEDFTKNVARYVVSAVNDTRQAIQSLVPQVFGSSAITLGAARARSFVATTNISLGVERATRAELVNFASDRLKEIKSQGLADVTAEAETSFWRVLNDFVRDDGPTPQLAPTGDGTIELQWLAGGTFVSAIFDESGSFDLFALRNDSEVLVDFEAGFGQSIDVDLFDQVELIFSEMGKSAITRPALWA
jgi:hypothetical protein